MTFATVLQATDAIAGGGIGPGALAFMLVCIGLVTALTAWCFYRVLTTKSRFDSGAAGPDPSPEPGQPRKDGRL